MSKVTALIPFEMPAFSSVAAPTQRTIQAVGDYVAGVFIAEEDATITTIGGYVDLLTGSPGTVRIGIQSVSTVASQTVTFTAGTTSCNGTFTLTVNQQIVFSTTGTLPAAITAGTTYFVRTATSTIITISATLGGTAITFATAGTGTHTLSTVGGIPTGTWIGSGTFTGNGTNFPNFSNKQWTLSTNATITRGQYYAIVILAESGTFNGSNNVRFYHSRGTAIGTANNIFPYSYAVEAGAVVAKSTGAGIVMLSASSATREYGYAVNGSSITAWNSGASPNERGIIFNIPTGVASTFKVSGVKMVIGPTNAGATWDLTLYDSAGTVLQNKNYTNTDAYNTNSIFPRNFYFDESTLTALSCNTDYRIAIKATSASLGCVQYIQIGTGWSLNNAFMPGGKFQFTSRTGAGAWTNTNDVFPMQLIIDDITNGGGGTTSSSTATFNPFSG
jgi:hypothetical protein